MDFDWIKIPHALLTLAIVLAYGLFVSAVIRKIGARAGRRYGIPVYQNYIDLIKNYSDQRFHQGIAGCSRGRLGGAGRRL